MHTVVSTANAYLFLKDVAAFVNFTEEVFGATVLKIVKRDNNTIAHAEVQIGNSVLMAAEPTSPPYYPASLYVYVENYDQTLQQALAAEAVYFKPMASQPQENEKYGAVKDSNDNIWWIVAG